jgi:hypothetical protein
VCGTNCATGRLRAIGGSVRTFFERMSDDSLWLSALLRAKSGVSAQYGRGETDPRLWLPEALGVLGRSSNTMVASVSVVEAADVGGSVGDGVEDVSKSRL